MLLLKYGCNEVMVSLLIESYIKSSDFLMISKNQQNVICYFTCWKTVIWLVIMLSFPCLYIYIYKNLGFFVHQGKYLGCACVILLFSLNIESMNYVLG